MSARQSSVVDKALRQVANGKTAYQAAKDCGLALSTIYRAIARQRAANAAAEASAPPAKQRA
jgi:transposase